MRDHPEIRLIVTGIIAGLCASIIYPLILFVPFSLPVVAAMASFLGPAIGIGSLGLRQLIRLHGESAAATLGAVHNLLAGALFTAMALVQLAVKDVAASSSKVIELQGIWWGLDVAWDIYIGLGTIFFGCAMFRHPRFGMIFAGSGVALGVAEILLNVYTFPAPPAASGLFDIGPFVGLWYLAATIQAWRSLGWARQQLHG
jgi:hypothetical protein